MAFVTPKPGLAIAKLNKFRIVTPLINIKMRRFFCRNENLWAVHLKNKRNEITCRHQDANTNRPVIHHVQTKCNSFIFIRKLANRLSQGISSATGRPFPLLQSPFVCLMPLHSLEPEMESVSHVHVLFLVSY